MGKAKKVILETIRIMFIAIAVTFVACFVGFIVLINFLPHDNDIKSNDAIAIAQYVYGYDKVYWLGANAEILGQDPESEPTPNTMRSHYSYYVVGEKAGKEVYLIIPSDPSLEKPFETSWAFDHSFMEIVEKFNEHGANYVAEETYGNNKKRINLINYDSAKNAMPQSNGNATGGGTFYERLDVKAIFSYDWTADGYRHNCIVTQEGGELKSYESVSAVS